MQDKSYTWKKYLNKPYESIWSSIEKFCLLNGMTELMFHNFALNTNYSTINLQEFVPYFIYRNTNPDKDKIHELLQIDNKWFSVLNPFSVNEYSTILNCDLHFCPKCMKLGYHSFFHQLRFIDKCFIHKKELLIKANNRDYSVQLYKQNPYDGVDVKPNVIDLALGKKLMTKKLSELSFGSPKSIRIIDPNYSQRRDSEIYELNKSTKKVLYNLLFRKEKNISIPILMISVDEEKRKFKKCMSYYSEKYSYSSYSNDMKIIPYPSVYLSIYDYVQKILGFLGESEIHRLSYNLRYEQNMNLNDKDKYIAMITSSCLLAIFEDEMFFKLKYIWPSAKKLHMRKPYYVYLQPLENESYTHDGFYYHYISTVIARRISSIVHNQIKEQWHEGDGFNHSEYPYKIKLPQYIVTFDKDIFSIYECK